MKKILILGVFIFVGIFIYKYWDSDIDLGNHYYYLPDYEALDVGSPYEPLVYKSYSKHVIENIIISPVVIKAKNRGNYILAIQIRKNDTVRRYFIIDKKTDKVYRNMNREEFLKFCFKKGITPI